MIDDVLLNKKESIERCVGQAKRYYEERDVEHFELDFLHQDAIAINIQRACEQCIDLANYTIRRYKLGTPRDSRGSFSCLAREGVISPDLLPSLKGMVGFRNVLVHQYKDLDLAILEAVIERNLLDLLRFSREVMGYFENHPLDVQGSR